jgi:hypothetical protein
VDLTMPTIKCDDCEQIVVLDMFGDMSDDEKVSKLESHAKRCVMNGLKD